MDKPPNTDQGSSAGTTHEPGPIHEVTNNRDRSRGKQGLTQRPKGGQGGPSTPGKGKSKPSAKIAANFSGTSSTGTPNRRSPGGSNKREARDDKGRTKSKNENGGVINRSSPPIKIAPEKSPKTNDNEKGTPQKKPEEQKGSPQTGSGKGSPQGFKGGEQTGSPQNNGSRQRVIRQKVGVSVQNGYPHRNSRRQGMKDKYAGPNTRSPQPIHGTKPKHPQKEILTNGPKSSPAKEPQSDMQKSAREESSPKVVRTVKAEVESSAPKAESGSSILKVEQEPAESTVPGSQGKMDAEGGPGGTDTKAASGGTNDEDMEKLGIFKLHKRKLKFPRAKYFCRLCNYHMNDLNSCEEHVAQTRHIRLVKNKFVADNFADVPDLSSSHLAALSEAIEGVVEEVGLTDKMMNERKTVMQRVNSVIQEDMPDCQVDLYGSSLSGLGFKTSDVNLNLRTSGKRTPAEMLVAAHKVVETKKELFKDIGCKFEDKFPVIYFTDTESDLYCEMGTGSDVSVATSKLLLEYRNYDPRARMLVIAFRHWAHLLEIDRPRQGSIPPYVYSLKVIYFLQRCEPPILPVLQENELLTLKNEQSLGDLWVELFHFYLVKRNLEEEVISIKSRVIPTRKDLNIQSRRVIVDDPCAPPKKSITKYLSSAEVFNYIMDCFYIALEYFSSFHGGEVGRPSSSSDQKSVQSGEVVPQENHIREQTPQEINLEQSGCVEDKDAIIDQLNKMTFQEDGHSSSSDDKGKISPDSTCEQKLGDPSGDLISFEDSLSGASGADQTDSSIRRDETSITKDKESDDTPQDNRNEISNDNIERTHTEEKDESGGSDDKPGTHSSTNGDLGFDFRFDAEKLSGRQKVPKICNNCQLEGHIGEDCEEDKFPDLQPLPPMQDWYLARIQQLCDFVSDQFSPKRQEYKERGYVVKELERFIQYHSDDKIKLALFGSSVNGFGFQNSDLDICMTFTNNETGECLNVPEVIQWLSQMLRKHHELFAVIPITTAKVPIVKFTHRPTKLEGDISLYNLLAQRNTKLLATYAGIDKRVCRLGHVVKAFAKECGIADASRGSLSSYAYVLMTIYFLQQTAPPVIPVLQELYTGSKTPERIVEGRNTWFYEHVNQLPSVWKGYMKNKQTEAELFLDFLRFYTETFDFDKYVVCIRQHKALTRFEKMWMGTNKGFTIEDPFDLDHNLGGALSRRMSNYIMLIFRQGRERFGNPQKVPTRYYQFFFDYDYLTDGQPPPNDRGCRICGKIGHFLKDCPIKMRGKERRREKKEARTAANTPQKNSDQQPGQGTPKKPQEATPKKPQEATPSKAPALEEGVKKTPNLAASSGVSTRDEGAAESGLVEQISTRSVGSNNNNERRETSQRDKAGTDADGEVVSNRSEVGSETEATGVADMDQAEVNTEQRDRGLDTASARPTSHEIPEPSKAPLSPVVTPQRGTPPNQMSQLRLSSPAHDTPPFRHHGSPPTRYASPPRPTRTPDRNIPHGRSPSMPPFQQGGQPMTPPGYPHPGQMVSPLGHGHPMGGLSGYPPGQFIPQPSREFMHPQGLQQAQQGIFGPHSDIALRQGLHGPQPDVIPSGQGMSMPVQPHGHVQGGMSPRLGGSLQYVGVPREEVNAERVGMDPTYMARGQVTTPPRQGATPPRQGATPPHRGATPPRQVATPPHLAGAAIPPLMGSPIMPQQAPHIPSLMSIPVGASPDRYFMSPMNQVDYGSPPPPSSPKLTQSPSLHQTAASPQPYPGSPQLFPGSPQPYPGSPQPYPGSPQPYPGSPQGGMMVYPNHPGASPIWMRQPHPLMTAPYHGHGHLPQSPMNQPLPLMHNGEMQLAHATMNLHQMLGLSPSQAAGPHPQTAGSHPQTAGSHPQTEMGLSWDAHGGPS